MGEGEQEANGGQLHWQSLGGPLTVRVAKWGGVEEAASLDPKAGRGPGSQVAPLFPIPHRKSPLLRVRGELGQAWETPALSSFLPSVP